MRYRSLSGALAAVAALLLALGACSTGDTTKNDGTAISSPASSTSAASTPSSSATTLAPIPEPTDTHVPLISLPPKASSPTTDVFQNKVPPDPSIDWAIPHHDGAYWLTPRLKGGDPAMCQQQAGGFGFAAYGFADLDHCLRFIARNDGPKVPSDCEDGWAFAYGFGAKEDGTKEENQAALKNCKAWSPDLAASMKEGYNPPRAER